VALPQPRQEAVKAPLLDRIKDLDPLGSLFLSSSTVCLLLALQLGGSTYSWSSPRIIGLFVGFGVLICVFAMLQVWRGPKATVPPHLLRNRQVISAWAFSFFFGGSYFTFAYYLPIYFQSIKGASATRSGIDSLALLLTCVISNIVIGAGGSVLGYYSPFVVAGMATYCVGCGLITTLGVHTPFAKWFSFELLTGIGLGAGFALPSLAVQTVLSTGDIPVGTTLCNFFFALGGTVFLSVAQAIFQNGLLIAFRKHLPGLDPGLILKTGATNLETILGNAHLGNKRGEALSAYMEGLRGVFILILGCSAASFLTACFWPWKTTKKETVEA